MSRLLGNYNKKDDLIIKSGNGLILKDTNQNEYLDCYSGVCVMNLGHNPSGWSEMISRVGSESVHISNYFYNPAEIRLSNHLSELVKESIPNAKVFFCNSGTEANEGALKFAILQNNQKQIKSNIMAFKGGFHGRSLGSLSCTYNPTYRGPFMDHINKVHFWEWNKTDDLRNYIIENNINIIINEPIQGEGGVIPMTDKFAKLLDDLHTELKFIWIIDEVQTGMGRCGYLFAHHKYNIKPDYVSLAKALGNGIPIGAVICSENTIIKPGEHGTTFGGNPFATGVAEWTLNKIINDDLVKRANEMGEYLTNKLRILSNHTSKIIDIRGMGLLIGLQFDQYTSVYDIIDKLKKKKILCISAGNNTLRICPPLIITENDIDRFVNELTNILDIDIPSAKPSTSLINDKFQDSQTMVNNDSNHKNIFKTQNIFNNMNSLNGLREFPDKIIVWKISGDIDDVNFITLLNNINKWSKQNYKIAIVFGAGTAINNKLKQTDIKIEYIKGQRKTTIETIGIIQSVIQSQQQRLIELSKQILTDNELVFVDQPIFTSNTNLFDTHGYVIEPSDANVEEIYNIWNNSNIALVSFMGIYDDMIHNANADICASCLAIKLNADWVGYSVAHENDIKQINIHNITLDDINIGSYAFSEGFKMKLTEVRKIITMTTKPDVKCWIGSNNDLPDSFNDYTESGVWIRKKPFYNVGLIGSRGYIGSEIVKYIKHNNAFKLHRFSLGQNYNQSELTKSDNSIKSEPTKTDNSIKSEPTKTDNSIKSELTKTDNSTEPIILESLADINSYPDIDIWISACPNNILKNNINLIKPNIPIIDVSSDFRHKEGWEYGMCYINTNIYTHRISNPGCYSSAVICALNPLKKQNQYQIEDVHITGISSYSGAGKDYMSKFPNLHKTLIPYQPLNHSQKEEMEKYLNMEIHFVPIVTDQFNRGILCSIQVDFKDEVNIDQIKSLYESSYANNKYIKTIFDKSLVSTETIANTTDIILSNFSLSSDNKTLHIQSMIDNLTIGGGFSSYINLCRYFGIDEDYDSNQNKMIVPVDSVESYDNYIRSIEFPAGFKMATTNVPFIAKEIGKKKVLQFTCLRMDQPSEWRGVYTKNPICGNPVLIGRKLLANKKPIKAIWFNNKISNVGVKEGLDDAQSICDKFAKLLNANSDEIVPLSTGIIGWRLPVDDMLKAVGDITQGEGTVSEMARAIMTTDTYPKAYMKKLSNGATIVGVAKGAGMIEPNMGTTLITIMTDAKFPSDIDNIFTDVVNNTFNCISIDGDTSTSDACLIVSSSKKPAVSDIEMKNGLFEVCDFLAKQIVWNGEGVQHVMEVYINGAKTKNIARQIGKNIVNSPLVKAAIYGNDPNVGRIIGAMGRNVDLEWSKVDVKIGDEYIFKSGSVISWNSDIEKNISNYMKSCQIYHSEHKPAYPVHNNSIEIIIDLNDGNETLKVIGGDLTVEYVKINGDYRS
jgi:glutamate N-acetyltransferase/amino-acid acetyltransferase